MAAALSVPKNRVAIIIPGTPFFLDVEGLTTPGTEQVLLTVSVPANIIRSLQQVVVICRMEGYFRILAGTQLIGSGRTGAAESNVPFSWVPSRPILPGVNIQVIFKARIHSPIVSVEAFLQASDTAS